MTFSDALDETSLVLDTDVFTHLRNRQPNVERSLHAYIYRLQKPPALTSMTIFEALNGIESEALKGNISEERAQIYRVRISDLSQTCPVLNFDQPSAEIAAMLFPRLSKRERNIHWRDLFIVATAVAHNHGVATQNVRDFELIAMHLPSRFNLQLARWKP